jgi:pimeloyl-ACP methyl ester carboxylesterase
MGGFGAVVYAAEHEELVDGLILLAPSLGPEDVIQEVADAGGLAAWSPPDGWRGIEDELSVPGGLLADVLPAEQKQISAGGHKFLVWRPILATLLPRALGPPGRPW